jgi:hypothetical protein
MLLRRRRGTVIGVVEVIGIFDHRRGTVIE